MILAWLVSNTYFQGRMNQSNKHSSFPPTLPVDPPPVRTLLLYTWLFWSWFHLAGREAIDKAFVRPSDLTRHQRWGPVWSAIFPLIRVMLTFCWLHPILLSSRRLPLPREPAGWTEMPYKQRSVRLLIFAFIFGCRLKLPIKKNLW